MKTRLWSLISYGAVALALAACSPPAQKAAEPAKPVASAEWTKLVNDFIDDDSKANPSSAFYAGRAEYAGVMPNWGEDGLKAEIARLHDWKSKAEAVDAATLDDAQKFERDYFLAVLDGASTLIFYFDGVQEIPPPLVDPARVAKLQQLMNAGTGLVALHQASTLPVDNTTVPLADWLGAKRNGMLDRTTEKATLKIAAASHPIVAGVGEITNTDEFYPTLAFNARQKVTPILRAEITPTWGDAKKQAASPPARGEHTVGWAFERTNGGRSFGFTGGHYMKVFEEPNLRQLLVNAIAWTAKIDVPATGINIPGPIVGVAAVNRAAENRVLENPWGTLRWYTSAEMGNTRTMTTGVAIIKPGLFNPRHFHPNCDEILHVVSGKIKHTMNEVTVEMNPGDTVSIPQGVLHNAANIGTEDAVLAISFSTAYREAVGYDTK